MRRRFSANRGVASEQAARPCSRWRGHNASAALPLFCGCSSMNVYVQSRRAKRPLPCASSENLRRGVVAMDYAASSPLARAGKAALSLLLYRKKARQRFRAKNIRSSLTRFLALRLPTTFLRKWGCAAEQITLPAASNRRICCSAHVYRAPYFCPLPSFRVPQKW